MPLLLPESVFTSVATPHWGHGGLGFIKPDSESEKIVGCEKNRAVRDHFFRMGKHPTHHGGKGAAKGAVCSPSRGKTCGLELAKVKRMGFKVFAFKQRSEDGDSE